MSRDRMGESGEGVIQRRRRVPFSALLVAGGISLTGTTVSLVAVPWYVLTTTGSPAATGIVGFATVLAMVAAGAVGGPLVDRLGYRRASIAADLFSGAATAAIPALHAAVGLRLWQLIALAVVRSVFDSLGGTARISMLPELTRAAGLLLERGNSLWSLLSRSSAIVGAALAGFLITLIGPANVLWIDAASFVLSGLVVFAAIPQLANPAPSRPPSFRAYGGELAKGLAYLRRDRLIAAITVILAAVNFVDGPLVGVVLPVYAQQSFGSSLELGLLFSTNAAGGMVGTLLFAVWAPRLQRWPTFVLSFVALTVCLWVLALAPNFATALVAYAGVGLMSGPINPLIFTIVQERAPVGIRGRVVGVSRSLAFAASPFGILVAGMALQSAGVRTTMLAVAGLWLAVTVTIWVNPALKGMNVENVRPAS